MLYIIESFGTIKSSQKVRYVSGSNLDRATDLLRDLVEVVISFVSVAGTLVSGSHIGSRKVRRHDCWYLSCSDTPNGQIFGCFCAH